MTAVAKRAVAYLATALVLFSFVALPLFASSDVTGIVEGSDGEYYYYVDGKKQYWRSLFYYNGFYYYMPDGDTGALARDGLFLVNSISGDASGLSIRPGQYYYFDEYCRMVFPTYGANSGSDYRASYDISMNTSNIEHMAYVVDKQDWTPYMFPFKDRDLTTKYCGYYTYVPCIASLPVEYDFPGYTVYAKSESGGYYTSKLEVNRVFTFSLSLTSFDDDKARCILNYTLEYPGSDPVDSSLTLSEGVDFESTCVFIGCYYGYEYLSDGYYTPFYAAFLIDNKFTYFPLGNTLDYNWVTYNGFIFMFADSSNEPIHPYTLGFATTYAGDATNGSYPFSIEEYQYGWNLLYGLVYPSNNMRAWINELYASALSPPDMDMGPTLDDVIDVLSGEIDSMKDVIHGDLEDIKDSINNPVSTIKPPPVKLPSSDQNQDLNDIESAEGEINGFVDSIFDNIDDIVNQYLVGPPSNLTDYIMLASVFTQMGNAFFSLPGMDLIATGLTFVFLVWVMGLNLSAIRHSAERRQSREETRQYRSEQRAYWKFQFNRWNRRR